MLAQARRRRHLEAHRAVDLDRRPEGLRLAVARMIHLHDHPALEHLGIGQDTVHGVDRRRRDVGALQTLEPFPGGPGPERGFDERHQHVAVKDAIAVGREAQIALPLRVLDRATEERPELLGEDRDDQVAVARLQGRIRHDRGVARAERCRNPPVRPEVLRDVREERDLTVEQRQVDVGALTRSLAAEQRARDGERAEQCPCEVGHRQAHARRSSARLAGDGHRAAHRLQRQIEGRPVAIRPVLPVGRDGADDDSLIERPELRVREAHALHDPRPEVLPDDVGLTHEVVEDFAAPVAREIERQRLLVPVDREEVRRLAVGQERRAHHAHRIAAVRILDLDHLGAHVGEQHRAIGAREHA